MPDLEVVPYLIDGARLPPVELMLAVQLGLTTVGLPEFDLNPAPMRIAMLPAIENATWAFGLRIQAPGLPGEISPVHLQAWTAEKSPDDVRVRLTTGHYLIEKLCLLVDVPETVAELLRQEFGDEEPPTTRPEVEVAELGIVLEALASQLLNVVPALPLDPNELRSMEATARFLGSVSPVDAPRSAILESLKWVGRKLDRAADSFAETVGKAAAYGATVAAVSQVPGIQKLIEQGAKLLG